MVEPVNHPTREDLEAAGVPPYDPAPMQAAERRHMVLMATLAGTFLAVLLIMLACTAVAV